MSPEPESTRPPALPPWPRLGLWLARRLPWRARWALARLITAVTSRGGTRLDVARANLDIAFGDHYTPAQKRRIARESLVNLVGCLLDAAAIIPRLNAGNWSRYVRVPPEDVAALHAELAKGKGALVMFSHYGNWELMGACMSFMGFHPCNVVARRQAGWSNQVIEDLRTRTGNTVIYKEGAVMATLRALKRGEIVGLSIDQNFSGGIFVPFFGLPAGTTDSLAGLARAGGAPIVPLVCAPNGDGTYAGRFLPAIHADRTPDKAADLVRTTEACFAVLEATIRARPELWLWGHKRWKSRPPGEAPGRDPYARVRSRRAASAL